MSRCKYGCLLGLLLILAIAAPAQAGPNCPVPESSLPSDPVLPMTVKALETHRPIKLVTIGVVTDDGRVVDTTRGFSIELAEILRRKTPGQEITLDDKRLAGRMTATMETQMRHGGGAQAMIDLLKTEILPDHPTLILWSVGTFAAVKGTDPRTLASDVIDSLEMLKAAKVDVILIDMQYSPAAAQMIDFLPYLEAVQVAADTTETPLFGRFGAMRAWSDDDVFDLDGMAPESTTHMVSDVDRCLGAGLAEIIQRAATLHPSESQVK